MQLVLISEYTNHSVSKAVATRRTLPNSGRGNERNSSKRNEAIGRSPLESDAGAVLCRCRRTSALASWWDAPARSASLGRCEIQLLRDRLRVWFSVYRRLTLSVYHLQRNKSFPQFSNQFLANFSPFWAVSISPLAICDQAVALQLAV